MNTGRVVSGRDLGMLRGPFVGDGEARKIGHGDSSLRLTALVRDRAGLEQRCR